jgi:hypothetical protein
MGFVLSHPCRRSASRMGHPGWWLCCKKRVFLLRYAQVKIPMGFRVGSAAVFTAGHDGGVEAFAD